MYQTAFITGATKGIGLAIAEKLAAENLTVFTCARNKEELMTWEKKMKALSENKHQGWVCDLTDKAQINAMLNDMRTQGLHPDILINNAALFSMGLIMEESDEHWRRMMSINLDAPRMLTKEFVPEMLARQVGYVFNISSITALKVTPMGGAYAVSKQAISGFSKMLREDLKNTPVKVTCIYPGATWSASWEGIDIDPERLIDARDIADAIWFCCNTSARSVCEEIIIRPSAGDLPLT